jgi:hypothetical protein
MNYETGITPPGACTVGGSRAAFSAPSTLIPGKSNPEPTNMNATRNIISTITILSLACLAHAADPPDGETAGRLEKQIIGYWAPDSDAMMTILTEEKEMSQEDAAKFVEESAKLTIHAEQGRAHVHTTQGIVSAAFEIVGADKTTGTLSLRAVGPPDAPKTEAVKISIRNSQIIVASGELPFVLKKIGEDEFMQRKAALPAAEVGP